jgi:hypothetical protein
VPAAEREAVAGSGGAGRPVGGGLREEGAAGPVEVAGEDVQDVDQPAGQGAVRDGTAADAAVYGGGGRGGQFAGERADRVGVDVAGLGGGLRGEVLYRLAEFVGPLHQLGEFAEVGELLLEEDVRHGREQQRVGAGADGHVPVGEFGGTGAAGVDDGQGAAARLEGLELAGEVGGGAQAAVGFEGVGADQQQVVGAVEVGHGDRVGVAVEQAAGDVLGHLVEGGRGEEAAGAEAREQHGRVEGAGHGVHVRVAEDGSDGVRPVPLDDRPQSGRDGVEGLSPGGLAQFAVLAHERRPQPVGVAVGRPERGALRADEPLAEHVVAVPARARHPGPLDGEREPARRLAEGTDAQSCSGVGGGGHGSSRRGWRRR